MAVRPAEPTRLERIMLRLMPWYDETAAKDRAAQSARATTRAIKVRARTDAVRADYRAADTLRRR